MVSCARGSRAGGRVAVESRTAHVPWLDVRGLSVRHVLRTRPRLVGGRYFNLGRYTLPDAGVTRMDFAGGGESYGGRSRPNGSHAAQQSAADPNVFSAYRLHDRDPLFYRQGMCLTWRNGDPAGCRLDNVHRESEPVSLRSLVLTYEWPRAKAQK